MSLDEINGQTAATQRPTLSVETDNTTRVVMLVHPDFAEPVAEYDPVTAVTLGIEIAAAGNGLMTGHPAKVAPVAPVAPATSEVPTSTEAWRTVTRALLGAGLSPYSIRGHGQHIYVDLHDDQTGDVDTALTVLGMKDGCAYRSNGPGVYRWNADTDKEFIKYGQHEPEYKGCSLLPGWWVGVSCTVRPTHRRYLELAGLTPAPAAEAFPAVRDLPVYRGPYPSKATAVIDSLDGLVREIKYGSATEIRGGVAVVVGADETEWDWSWEDFRAYASSRPDVIGATTDVGECMFVLADASVIRFDVENHQWVLTEDCAHRFTSGAAGVVGQCEVECVCGTGYYNFDTLAEASYQLARHIWVELRAAAGTPVTDERFAEIMSRISDLHDQDPKLTADYIADLPEVDELVTAELGPDYLVLTDGKRLLLRAGVPSAGDSVAAVEPGHEAPIEDSLPFPERYDVTIVGRTATVDGPLLHVRVPSWSDPFKLDRDTVPAAVFEMPIGTTVTALLTQTGQYDDPTFSSWEWPVADGALIAESTNETSPAVSA